MQFFKVFFFALMALAMMMGVQADPKVNVNAIKKGGRIIKKGLGIIGAAGTAHEVYNQVRNRGQQG